MNISSLRRILSVLMLLVLASLHSCGSNSVGPTPPSDIPVSLEGLDGASGVAVDSSFLYEFDSAVDTPTVSTSTYFIVPTLASTSANISVEKSEYNTTICDTAYALETEVSCESSTSCILDPTNDLEGGTSYTVCLTAEILYADAGSWLIRNAYAAGDPIDPVAITFTTASDSFAVASVLDASGVPIQRAGSTGVNSTVMTINFTDEPVSGSDLIEVTCDLPSGSALGQPSHDSVVSNSSVVFTVYDAFRYQLMDCTLLIDSTVTSVSGDILGSDYEYEFTTGCAVSDDFNSDTQSCWGADISYPNISWDTWPDLLANALTFNPVASAIDYSLGETEKLFGFWKEVVVGTGDYSIATHLENIAGIETTGGTYGPACVFISLTDAEFNGYFIGVVGDGTKTQCIAARISNGTTVEERYENCSASEYYFRIREVDSSIVSEYSTDGNSWDEFRGGALTHVDMSGEERALTVFYRTGDSITGNDTADVDYVVVEGMTSEEQY